MAYRVSPHKPQPKLYTPTMPAGGQVLGGISNLDIPEQKPLKTTYAGEVPVTVGDFYRLRGKEHAQAQGRVIHGLIELAAPPLLLGEMALIKARHGYDTYQQVFELPWDPEGKWKNQADAIWRKENAAGDREIANLPLPSAARATGRVVSNAYTVVGDYASDATIGMINASRETGRGVARGFLSAVAMTGKSLFDFANEHKSSFE